MISGSNITIRNRLFLSTLIFIMTVFSSCAQKNEAEVETVKKNSAASASLVKKLNGVDEFNSVIESAGDKLIIFDFYADWCGPCRILSPMLEKIASEKKNMVDVYKVDVDKNKDLAGAMRVRGIPYVVLVKNKSVVKAFTGVQPKQNYVNAIDEFYAE